MVSASDIVYYSLFVGASVLSFKAMKHNLPGLNYLRALLIIGLVNEMLTDFFKRHDIYKNVTYHFYIPIEYVLLALFFYSSVHNKMVKKIILLSIPFYIALTFSLTFFYYSIQTYPGIAYNIDCFFTIVWAVFILFNLEVKESLKVTAVPLFWICTGIIIFYMGMFFFNAVYNYLLSKESELANSLRSIISLNLNYLFYIIWSYAFICSIRLKKYSTR